MFAGDHTQCAMCVLPTCDLGRDRNLSEDESALRAGGFFVSCSHGTDECVSEWSESTGQGGMGVPPARQDAPSMPKISHKRPFGTG